ncbi:hypothetical protein L1887_09225 [Cichorium endivia]|nr:hypothetical protein L1887_09225 [Cichorium endivia]
MTNAVMVVGMAALIGVLATSREFIGRIRLCAAPLLSTLLGVAISGACCHEPGAAFDAAFVLADLLASCASDVALAAGCTGYNYDDIVAWINLNIQTTRIMPNWHTLAYKFTQQKNNMLQIQQSNIFITLCNLQQKSKTPTIHMKYINVQKIILSPSSLYKSPLIPPTNVASKPFLVN